MPKGDNRTTWDGKPIATSPPFGVTVVVYRIVRASPEFLILHRAHAGSDFDGDWAWTPPSGARFPGEEVPDCARRELLEETGLDSDLVPVEGEAMDWVIFAAAVPEGASIRLSTEHDKYEWAPFDKAVAICKPAVVSKAIRTAATDLNL